MGYYANGDTRKMMQSSEDDEGYENQLSNTTTSTGLFNQTNTRNKQYFTSGISQEISPAPKSIISDDTDQPFWAEDELSNSESRHQLNTKQRRRYSLSYRNRITVHRTRSLLFQSSSSSLDSISEQISPGVSKQERYTSRLNIEGNPRYNKVKKKCSRKRRTSFISSDKCIYVRYKYINQKQMQKQHPFLMNRKC